MTPTREICKICYEINRVGFTVPDSLWAVVAPEEFRNRVLCLRCFTRLADEKMVAWDEAIEFWPVSAVAHLDWRGEGNADGVEHQ